MVTSPPCYGDFVLNCGDWRGLHIRVEKAFSLFPELSSVSLDPDDSHPVASNAQE